MFLYLKDLFFNPINNTGFLEAKLKNSNLKKHKIDGTYGKSKKNNIEEVCNSNFVETAFLDLSDEDYEFFKHCDAIEQESLIEEKLALTNLHFRFFLQTEIGKRYY